MGYSFVGFGFNVVLVYIMFKDWSVCNGVSVGDEV